MAVAELTLDSLTLPCFALKPGQRRPTKAQLRQAVRDHADGLEFRNLDPFGHTYLSLRGAARYGEHSIEVRCGNALLGVIHIDTRHGLDHVQYVVT